METPHKPTQFALIVDTFGIKYKKKQDAQDLINALKSNYEAVSVDRDRKIFCSIKLKWD